jgi:PEP-CTERM motif
MKRFFGLMAVAAFGAVAYADGPRPVGTPLLQNIAAFPVGDNDDDFGPRVVTRNYDNWTNPPSALTSLFRTGTDEIADDLTLTPVAGVGLLSTMGINLANIDAASVLQTGTMAVRFYRLDNGSFINGFNANYNLTGLAGGGLAGNGSVRLSFPAASLEGLGFIMPTSGVHVSLQHTAAVFAGAGGLTNLGLQTRGPVGIGSSTDNFTNVTLGGTFNFAGAPLANTGIFIDTNDVPEPASLALLALGAIAAFRRR